MVARVRYECRSCDYRSTKWFGRCPQCGSWDSLVESSELSTRTARSAAAVEPLPLPRIPPLEVDRLPTGIGELDRVLGGGLVPGAAILVGGEPGIGKSTLLLQGAAAVAEGGGRVLYVSGEESASQLRLRGQRLGVDSDRVLVVAEGDVDALVEAARRTEPQLLVVDSIQAVRCSDLDSPPGSLSQVREAAGRFVEFAKRSTTPVALVGHVTKEGTIAGPRTLEHMVDTVIHFEGDRHLAHRILRATKNRFGPCDELGVFRMGEQGLTEVSNPSEFLLAERPEEAPGSAVLASLEGSRTLLVEIQALVGHASQGSPRRSTLGIDSSRLAMVVAVLERRAGVELANRDLFVNVTGGLTVIEPAADLAVAAAVVSAVRQAPLPARWVLLGEIGLTGELRAVSRTPTRLREAARLGFTAALLPRRGHEDSETPGIESLPAADLEEALRLMFGAIRSDSRRRAGPAS